MEAEQMMELFDSFWFELEILKKQPSSATSSRFEADLVHENEDQQPSKPEVLQIPSLHTRSLSDDLSSETSFINCGSLSPDSVLHRPKLSTIVSGKEVTASMADNIPVLHKHEVKSSNKAKIERRRKKSGSKSLTDLQFEELKGFMDLGFVFSEEDKDSNLASIIPGLKKLGVDDDEAFDDESAISRPHLSEAWEVMEKRKKEKNPLMDWRFPSLSNEMDMKDNLRWWAHTVASTVR
uniref:uncharacterized protein LOC105351692 n=1 Tax=Fragaria vesca subsp. vesca TaxID=101020 RepID=UPI0005CB1F25|nr:PREDICTED: uncharacterized protein LOC105351692 [Fragaria vesca subsp. vesca]